MVASYGWQVVNTGNNPQGTPEKGLNLTLPTATARLLRGATMDTSKGVILFGKLLRQAPSLQGAPFYLDSRGDGCIRSACLVTKALDTPVVVSLGQQQNKNSC